MEFERAPGDSAGDRRPVGSDDRDVNGVADGSREPRLDPRDDAWEPDPLSLGVDGPGYAPVPLGGGGSDGEDVDDVRAPAPERPPVPTTASVRASMRPRRNDPWRRPAKDSEPGRSSSPPMRPPSIAARVLTAVAVVAAVAGVLIVIGPIDFGGGDAGAGGQGGKDPETERVAGLEAALRRESGQRYAWEMWAREFDPGRYRAVKRRAARRAESRDKATDGS